MTLWGVQRSCYYGKGDDLEAPAIWEPARALGGLPPPRKGPECCCTLAASKLLESANS